MLTPSCLRLSRKLSGEEMPAKANALISFIERASSEVVNAPETQTSSAVLMRAFMRGRPVFSSFFSMVSAVSGSLILLSTIRFARLMFFSGSRKRPSGSIFAFEKGSDALIRAMFSSLWIWRCWKASSRMMTDGSLFAKRCAR